MPQFSPITESEKQGIAKIRELFGDELPRDLDTDFYLRRWITGWKGDMKQIEPRLRNYIQSRKAFKLDAPNLIDQPMQPVVLKVFKYVSMSILNPPMINPLDNTIVIVHRFENVDMLGLPKLFTPSEYLYGCFVISELMMRQILLQEERSGKQSGFTLLYDMHGLRFGDFINPNAPHMKLANMGMAMQQEFFCDMLHQVVCVPVPQFMNIIWEIVKKFLNENTQKKFHLYTEHNYRQHLFEHIDPTCVPEFLGGKWRDGRPIDPQLQDLVMDPEKCCSIPQQASESDFRKPTWTPKEWTVHYIKPKQTFEVVKSVHARDPMKTMMRWQFDTNSMVIFAVYFQKEGSTRHLIFPKLSILVCTPSIPEENQLSCAEHGAGDYIFEFSNQSTSWFSLKLSYCIEEIE